VWLEPFLDLVTLYMYPIVKLTFDYFGINMVGTSYIRKMNIASLVTHKLESLRWKICSSVVVYNKNDDSTKLKLAVVGVATICSFLSYLPSYLQGIQVVQLSMVDV
jgi:hypothetical protein